MSQFLGQQISFEYYVGYLPAANIIEQQFNEASYFFSLVTKYGETLEKTSKNTPVIFWLGGGPGFTSQEANWNQIGPIQLDENLNPSLRQFSWNNRALLVFVDQPLGTGLSFTSKISATDTKEAYDHLKFFLKKFYKNFEHLLENPTYFSGSQYAGHFLPYFGEQIVKTNPVENLNFKGITLGNPWISSKIQSQTISQAFFDFSIANTNQQNTNTNSTSYIKLLNNSVFRLAYSIYNSQIPTFFPFNSTIYEEFSADISKSYQQSLSYLIENDYNVLIYSGQLDPFINSAGIQNLINEILAEKFYEQQKQIIYQQGSESAVWGNYQKFDNFTYVNVYNAGEQVPADQPQASLYILTQFLKGNL
ncbi:hypothetical protein PPERSA_04551 [Pseudocohnilembus persalinus]|uniref:Uncharacterized protein n=1 Tax=Pseudocohnilembus persalinus TaxID=266149 RepID=A0A0V0QE95_PSEPJ|nr:hypothetical protein PPERSA_04551 [Pseudocohnilembus persalinus]|eukprot:KRX00530.1 hypothetical protein PPERSA_04551 [Pseudocohnilembus persalinus]